MYKVDKHILVRINVDDTDPFIGQVTVTRSITSCQLLWTISDQVEY